MNHLKAELEAGLTDYFDPNLYISGSTLVAMCKEHGKPIGISSEIANHRIFRASNYQAMYNQQNIPKQQLREEKRAEVLKNDDNLKQYRAYVHRLASETADVLEQEADRFIEFHDGLELLTPAHSR